MRVMQLVHQYPPDDVGGTELYTQWLSRSLAQRGYAVEVFYRRSAPGVGRASRQEGEGLRVWTAWDEVLDPARRFLATFGGDRIRQALEDVLDQTSPGLVHLQHLMGLPVSVVRLLEDRRIPMVVTLHDYWWICANAQLLTNYSQEVCCGPRWHLNCARCALARLRHPGAWPALPAVAVIMAWRNRLLARSLARAVRLVSPSEFVEGWYVEHGVSDDRIVVIPHGVSLSSVVPRNRDIGTPLRLAYIGGLSWQKGVHVLIEAVGRLRGEVELWIAGDETTAPEYASDLRDKATSNVRFLGRLSREDVWATLSRVDVVTVPSLWYETFSFIISEAFAAGVPVVASRLGPLADRVRDNVDGLLVPPGDTSAWRDSLQRLVDEPDLLKRLTSNVRPPMTLEEHVDALEEVYEAVLREER